MESELTRNSFDPLAFLAKVGTGKTIVAYRKDQIIFSQGEVADAVFYIQKGGVKIVVQSEQGKEAVIGILEPGQFFGEGCMNGHSLRISTSRATEDSVITAITKSAMIAAMHDEPKFSELFVAYLLTRNSRVEDDLIDQLFNSSEKRLARLLLLLAKFSKEGSPTLISPNISQETLADMIGTTRSRVSFFMNKFRKLGFISYNGKIEVHNSLLDAVLRERRSPQNPSISQLTLPPEKILSCYPEKAPNRIPTTFRTAPCGTATCRDAESLGLIVTELVINSLKHAFNADTVEGKITVGYEVSGSDWKLSVADNGRGKPDGVFAQAKSGLGTGIVKALAKQLDSQVLTVSGPKGTPCPLLTLLLQVESPHTKLYPHNGKSAACRTSPGEDHEPTKERLHDPATVQPHRFKRNAQLAVSLAEMFAQPRREPVGKAVQFARDPMNEGRREESGVARDECDA